MSSKMIKVTLKVPRDVGAQAQEIARARAHEAAVSALWEVGELSASRAAQELDLGIHDFLDLLTTRGLPVVRGELNVKAIEEASRKLI
jgi:hypothetical protein